ncbi:fungal-specific transcription factor domain-containing protein [Gilbertella persicaria]|uniref:fungal-specific transcription factor domain-containing protein n=1 Tax=Gilbertella persicaria TaxID=101096 RepID=UPI00221F4993|nr:fungal-specific transcription factor domain-containing protein [Gilbertella persicaria]KAI8047424.1 fungal-specific transcription factor domain-containing protein [Gilbertella persicaria]
MSAEQKRIKCDGIKPACGKCIKFNKECTYTSVIRKRGPKQGHIDLLEQRLKKMEELISGTRLIPDMTQQQQPSIQPQTIQQPLPITPTPKITPPTIAPPITAPPAAPAPQFSYFNSTSPPQTENTWPDSDTIDHLVPLFFKHLEVFSPFANPTGLMQSIKNKTCKKFLLWSILSVAARFSNRLTNVGSPRWMSGEKFSDEARKLIPEVIEAPCLEHLQGLLIMALHEYGCARGPRLWTYSGLAIRMALELDLHKEPMAEQEDKLMSMDNWLWYETQRRTFWRTFIEDKVTSATTGRPQMMDVGDVSTLLPVWNSALDFNSINEFYQQSLDGSELICYRVVRDPHTRDIKGILVTPIDMSIPANMPLLSHIGLDSRFIELFVIAGKISQFINRGYKDDASSSSVIESTEIENLNERLDDWVARLPLSLRNTPANLEHFRNETSHKATQFVVSHVLHNALIVLLNRPSLVLADMPQLNTTSSRIQEKIHQSVDRCLAAADNVTVMLKDLYSKVDIVPPLVIYFVYITATVMVNNAFSTNPTHCQKAERALDEFYQFFNDMKTFWAMTDKLYFLIRDLYAVHKKAFSTHKHSQLIGDGDERFRLKSPLADMSSSTSDYATELDWQKQGTQEPGAFSFPKVNSTNLSPFDVWLQEQQLAQKKQ